MQVSKVRKGYKFVDSGFGKKIEIPEEWEVKRIEEITEIPISDGPHETPEFLSDGIPFLSIDNIQLNKLDFSKLRYISKKEEERFARKCKPKKK